MLTKLLTSHLSNAASRSADNVAFFHRNAVGSSIYFDNFCDADGTTAHTGSRLGDLTYWHHNDCTDWGDTAIDKDFGVSSLDAHVSRSLFDFEDDGDTTDFWSTQNVFTAQDIAGNLHGDGTSFNIWTQDQGCSFSDSVEHPKDHLEFPQAQSARNFIPSKPTERHRRPQIVRDWLSLHAFSPYPTPAEKLELAAATGYTERQLNNCLSNLRTREKHCMSIVLSQSLDLY